MLLRYLSSQGSSILMGTDAYYLQVLDKSWGFCGSKIRNMCEIDCLFR